MSGICAMGAVEAEISKGQLARLAVPMVGEQKASPFRPPNNTHEKAA
jgi:hypothetical protein